MVLAIPTAEPVVVYTTSSPSKNLCVSPVGRVIFPIVVAVPTLASPTATECVNACNLAWHSAPTPLPPVIDTAGGA